MNGIRANVEKLGAAIDELVTVTGELETAVAGSWEDILPALEKLRKAVDTLEYLVDDRHWPLPKYREMLFVY